MRSTPEIIGPHSISTLVKVTIGEMEQWILIRGMNKRNPLLLFLHGGPGNAQIGFAPSFQEKLEQHFLVVNWDQRGAGLSYNEKIKKESMTIGQFVDDAKQLVKYLLKRFQQRKMFLVGHSWGSIVGMKLIVKYPQYFHAYIGIGQIIHMMKGEKISYDYTLTYAIENKVENAVKQLKHIGRPPYGNLFEGVVTQRKWLNQFRGVMANHHDFIQFTLETIKKRREYTRDDMNNLLKGISFSTITLLPQMMKINFFQHITKVEVPVYFLLGEQDYNTPTILVKRFFNGLHAPKKRLFHFANVAHHLPFEDEKEFARAMCKIATEILHQ